MAMSGVDREDVDFGLGHFDGAFDEVAGGAHGGATREDGRGHLFAARGYSSFFGCLSR